MSGPRLHGFIRKVYKGVLSPFLHAALGLTGACRFQPTCSEYAAEAVAEHGLVRGCGLALWRLLRCQPFSRGGLDPVPQRHRDARPGTITIEPAKGPAAPIRAGHR